ncbi:hypothetical protein AbraIFM66951_012082 [Aspergillus brasiliensis]|uniref:Uncharacterized protein n=1 Tax=Aspergillus brasiliensis TaxID=319629 RepID=A0A9W5YKA8_9EURO|nr:hypothetical protein AbraCBS73388_010755 [Aspergillus brasiliensis]GKZ48315.1 hypothetical protein AbraIFM66951_012082 [Aspergillus brasiliensis]
MEKLPLEIKLAIAKLTYDRTRESLKALSRVNWEWNAIAGPVLYRHLLISLGMSSSSTWLPSLLHTQRVFLHVKRVSFVAVYNNSAPYPEQYRVIRDALEEVDFGAEYTVACPSREECWAPILNLIPLLPHLSDVDIVDRDGGPATLAQTISRYHPTCRVSLFSSSLSPGSAWDHSPLLHAVCHSSHEDSYRLENEKPKEMILRNIVHRAPRVRKVALQSSIAESREIEERPSGSIMGAQAMAPPEPAQWESICWPPRSRFTAECFQHLSLLTDLRHLKSWRAGWIGDAMLLQTIVDIHPFENLTRLALALFAPTTDNGHGFWSRAEAMLESLPPLTSLCLLGGYAPGFLTGGGVLRKHGPTLLELQLHRTSDVWLNQAWAVSVEKNGLGPRFSCEDILRLAHQLPRLRKLQICVQRRRGLEVDAYTALGRFACLEELDLVLNCLPEMDADEGPIPSRELTESEKGRTWLGSSPLYDWPEWYLQDLFINCAIDKPLAKAIFAQVSGSQRGPWLQRLTIHPLYGQLAQYTVCGPRRYCPGMVDEIILQHLAPTWTVELDLLTGLRTEPSFWSCVLPAFLGHYRLHFIVHSLWPTGCREDGRLKWHSWPLRSSDVETSQGVYKKKPM